MEAWDIARRTSLSSGVRGPAPLLELEWCFACDDVLVVPRDDGNCCRQCREEIANWPE